MVLPAQFGPSVAARGRRRSHPLVIRYAPWHIRRMRRRDPSSPSLHADAAAPADEASLLSFARWAQKNAKLLAHRLWRVDRSPADIEDLIQEAIARTVKSCEQGGVINPAAVLMTTVSRLAMNDCRDRSRHPSDSLEEIETFTPLVDPAPLPEDIVAAEQCWELVGDVLGEVDERMREAFLLHCVDGFSYRQIAKQLHVSPVTVQRDVTWVLALVMDAARHRRSA